MHQVERKFATVWQPGIYPSMSSCYQTRPSKAEERFGPKRLMLPEKASLGSVALGC